MDGPWGVRIEGLRGRERGAMGAVTAAGLMLAVVSARESFVGVFVGALAACFAIIGHAHFDAAQRATLAVGAGGLSIAVDGTTRFVARDQVLLALVDPKGTLILECRHFTLRVTPGGPSFDARREIAETIVRALRLAPSQQSLRFTGSDSALRALLVFVIAPVPAGMSAALVAALLGAFVSESMAHGAFLTLWITLTLIVANGLWPDTVTLASDGIHFLGPLRDRFIPWSTVTDVSMRDGVLVLEGARRRVFRVTTLRERPALWEGFVVAARALMAAARADAPPTPLRLRWDGGDVTAWRTRLSEVSGYRDSAMDLPVLDAILCNGGSPPDARIGAALALVARDPAARTRVRLAAEVTADPFARAALHAAAARDGEDRDTRIAHALAAIARRA